MGIWTNAWSFQAKKLEKLVCFVPFGGCSIAFVFKANSSKVGNAHLLHAGGTLVGKGLYTAGFFLGFLVVWKDGR